MLTVAGLSKAFGGRQLFDDVSLTLQSGERDVILFPQLKPK
jgi:ATPase subunit of ABC transporter with duplicated ATPase domains